MNGSDELPPINWSPGWYGANGETDLKRIIGSVLFL
jgi:hypothetical protein